MLSYNALEISTTLFLSKFHSRIFLGCHQYFCFMIAALCETLLSLDLISWEAS